MSRTVESITKSLKLRAESKPNSLTLRLGVKKLTLPFDVRALASNDYVFVHIPPSAAVLKITKSGLEPVTNVDEASEAVASFRKSSKRSGRKPSKVEIPNSVLSALRDIPSGYRLTYGADNHPRLVKMRKRKG